MSRDVVKTENGTLFQLTNNWREENQAGGIFTVDSVEMPKNKIICLVGCNGSGKTTVIEKMTQFLKYAGAKDISETKEFNPMSGFMSSLRKEEKKPNAYFMSFDKGARFVSTDKDGTNSWLYKVDMDKIFGTMSSNGESVVRRLNGALKAIKICIDKCLKEQVPLWIFIDDVDAGTSIDVICELKENLVYVNEHLNKHNLEHYIIVTSNSFEFARDLDCLYVRDMSPIKFTQYEEFKEFVLKTRKEKEKRDGTTETNN